MVAAASGDDAVLPLAALGAAATAHDGAQLQEEEGGSEDEKEELVVVLPNPFGSAVSASAAAAARANPLTPYVSGGLNQRFFPTPGARRKHSSSHAFDHGGAKAVSPPQHEPEAELVKKLRASIDQR